MELDKCLMTFSLSKVSILEPFHWLTAEKTDGSAEGKLHWYQEMFDKGRETNEMLTRF